MAALTLALASCSAPKYLTLPDKVPCPVVKNTCSYGIQNMDEDAKVENGSLVCHYADFDVQYTLSDELILSLTIFNNSNKSLLIDKSQCFVLYDGNSTQLFKDSRMSGSTTFNDVTGAINVSTNHGSVVMTIPPYSKWSPVINETNIRNPKIPEIMMDEGIHHLTVYDNPETVEFIIPYSFDGTMKKWNTSRNKIYVNTINVEHVSVLTERIKNFMDVIVWDPMFGNDYCVSYDLHGYYCPSLPPKTISSHEYLIIEQNGEPDYSELDRIDAINQKLFKKHDNAVRASHIIGGIITLPTVIFPILFWVSGGCRDGAHQPPR